VAAAKAAGPIQGGILGRLGRAAVSADYGRQNADAIENCPDGSDGAAAVQTEFEEVRTARTGEMESEEISAEESRTARTGYSLLTRNANEPSTIWQLKEFADPVRSVRVLAAPAVDKPRLPHLLSDGTLVIPFSSPERYFWWKGGQSVRQTKQELLAEGHQLERKENDAAPF
jgi:hypothetical protein